MQVDKTDNPGIFVSSNNTKSFSNFSVFNEGYQQDLEGGGFGFCFSVWTDDKLGV